MFRGLLRKEANEPTPWGLEACAAGPEDHLPAGGRPFLSRPSPTGRPHGNVTCDHVVESILRQWVRNEVMHKPIEIIPAVDYRL